MLCVFTLLVIYIMFGNTSLYVPFGLVCLLFSLQNILVDVYSSPQQIGNHRRADDSWCHTALGSMRDCDWISEVLICMDVANAIMSIRIWNQTANWVHHNPKKIFSVCFSNRWRRESTAIFAAAVNQIALTGTITHLHLWRQQPGSRAKKEWGWGSEPEWIVFHSQKG